MGSDPGLVDARFQVDCWATDFDACRAVSEAVRGRLERWTNASSPVVQDTFIEDVTDTWEDDAQLYRAMLQIRTIYRE
jgi:hypothetical protein